MSGTYDDLIGTPYSEMDCFELTICVLKRMGFAMEADFTSQWIRSYMPGETDPEEILAYDTEETDEPRKPGDILVMKSKGNPGTRATHVGVHIGKNLIIHSTRSVGVHVVPYRVVEPYTVEVISWKE